MLALVFISLVATACGGSSTVTTTVTPSTNATGSVDPLTTATSAPVTTTTTTTAPSTADFGTAMLALIQADDFAGTFDIQGSVTIATTEIGFVGVTSGDEDSSSSSLRFGPPLDTVTETVTLTGVLYERHNEGAWVQSLEADSEDGLEEYFDRIRTLSEVGEVGFRGRQVISFEPDVHPTVGELGFDGFTGDPEVQFLTELDGTPLHISIELDGVFENSVGIIIYEMTLSGIGSGHQPDLPEEYFIKYTSPQELPFTVGYPSTWTEDGDTETVIFGGTIGESVELISYLFGSDSFTLDEWANVTIDEVLEDPDATLDRDQTIALGPDARVWRIVDGTIQFESGPLYFIYAATLADGGAIDAYGFYPPGFEDLDYATLLDILATIDPVK